MAILLVVGSHVGLSALDGGYIGVDVFFVISGFLITGLIAEEMRRGEFSFANFYARRVRRLVPAAALVVVFTLTASLLLLGPLEFAQVSGSAIAASLYVSNFFFANEATEYFRNTEVQPLLHTWSLGVEEQFYLVWPGLLLLLIAGGRRVKSLGSRAPLLGLGVLSLASLAICESQLEEDSIRAFFSSYTRLWEFGVGAFVALIPARERLSRSGSELAAATGAALIVGSVIVLDPGSRFPGLGALPVVLGTALIIWSGASSSRGLVHSALSSAPMNWIGERSYGWYLWHWPLLVFAAVLEPGIGVPGLILVAAFSLLVADVSLRFVENPVRYRVRALRSRRAALEAGLLVSLAVVGLGLAVKAVGERALEGESQARLKLATADLPRHYGDRSCHADFVAVALSPDCVFGDQAANTRVFLIGDSHAGHFMPALEPAIETGRIEVTLRTKSNCPTSLVSFQLERLRRDYHECASWIRLAMLEAVAERPDLVIMASANDLITADGEDPVFGMTAAAYGRGLSEFSERISEEGIPQLLIQDVPQPGVNIPICLSREDWALVSARCSYDLDSGLNEPARGAVVAVARDDPLVRVADFESLVCPSEPCQPIVDGQIVFWDSNHLSAAFARRVLAAPLMAEVKGALAASTRSKRS